MDQKATLAQLREENAQYLLEKNNVKQQLNELTEERASQTGGLTDFFKQRDDLFAKVQEQKKAKKEIEDEWKQAERAYYAYQAELRKIKQERAAKEREERQKDYQLRQLERKAEKLDEQPHVAEITLIEQTIKFCNSLVQPKGAEKKEEKKTLDLAGKDGETLLLK